METTNFIYFTLGALSLFAGMLVYGPVKLFWNTIKSSISFRKPQQSTNVYCDDLQSQIDDLKEQVDNLAEALASRDKNRKSNTRREVRDYLEELRSK